MKFRAAIRWKRFAISLLICATSPLAVARLSLADDSDVEKVIDGVLSRFPAAAEGEGGNGGEFRKDCNFMVDVLDNKRLPGVQATTPEEAAAAIREQRAMFMRGGSCVGFVNGFRFANDLVKAGVTPLCIPRTVSNEQLVRVVAAFLDKHPKYHHLDSNMLGWAALMFAFPCAE